MTEKMHIGKLNTLMIDRDSDHGLFLMDQSDQSVLLPNIYVDESMHLGDTLEVFVYTDSQDRIVATTQRPLAMLGEFALMRAKDVMEIGAFVDWGLPKDLFVPKKMQKNPLEPGHQYIIRVAYDLQTDRLIGDTRIGRYLNHDITAMEHLKEVDMLVVARTPLGYKVIVNHTFEGMLYHNEIFESLKTGDRKKGYVKKVRDDGKLDLTLQPTGKGKEEAANEKVLHILKEHGGTLAFTYKSDAKEIQKMFGLSKKAYKKALTHLQNEGKINLDENSISFKS